MTKMFEFLAHDGTCSRCGSFSNSLLFFGEEELCFLCLGKRYLYFSSEISLMRKERDQYAALFLRACAEIAELINRGNDDKREELNLKRLTSVEVSLKFLDEIDLVSPCGDHVDCETCINNEDCVKETVKDSLMDDIAGSTGQE